MKKRIIIASVCAVAVILSGLIGFYMGKGAVVPASSVVEKTEANSIFVPGYDYMSMKAGEKTIPARLYNPGRNSCLIEAARTLPEGAEILRSGKLSPGVGLVDLNLSRTVTEG